MWDAKVTKCDSAGVCLNENGPHRLVCLKTWAPVDRTDWEGLGGVPLGDRPPHSQLALSASSWRIKM